MKKTRTIYDRLNKVCDKTLLNQEDIRKYYRTICDLLEECRIPHDRKSDDAVIQNEVVYESPLVKRQFEGAFFDTCVKMFGYWYDLNYLERKVQMNVDVEHFVKEFRHFEADGETIYMPALAPGFSHLYHTKIMLLDLKQYHKFIRECAKEMQYRRYDTKPFQYGLSSCELLVEVDGGYVVFHPIPYRRYLYDADGLKRSVSIGMKQELQEDWEQEIALLPLGEQHGALVAFSNEHAPVKKRLSRELEKLLGKQKRKQEEKADKE